MAHILPRHHPDSWPDLLPMVAYAFNSGKSATTEFSPFELLFKQQPNRPESFLLPPEADMNNDEDYYPNAPTETRKQVYHKGYNLNDLVIKKNHQTSGGKLHNHYQGLYVVVGQTGPVTYQIRQAANAGAKQEVRHYNELLPWRRQKLQHEMQREDEEEDVVLHDEQPVVNPRRSTRARRQTQFIQLENDRQSYQYREPLETMVEEHDND